MPATGMPSGSTRTPCVVPYTSRRGADLRAAPRAGTPKRSSSSRSHAQRAEVHEQRAARVGDVGDVRGAAGEPPDEEACRWCRRRRSPARAFALRARHVVEEPARAWCAEKYGSSTRPVFSRTRGSCPAALSARAARRRCAGPARRWRGGAACRCARSHSAGRLALVGDADGGDVAAAQTPASRERPLHASRRSSPRSPRGRARPSPASGRSAGTPGSPSPARASRLSRTSTVVPVVPWSMARTCESAMVSPRSAAARGVRAAGEGQRREERRGGVGAAVALDVDADEVPAAREEQHLGGPAADAAGEAAGAGDGHRVVARALHDEGGRGDPGELAVDVRLQARRARSPRRAGRRRGRGSAGASRGRARPSRRASGTTRPPASGSAAEERREASLGAQLERGREQDEAVHAGGLVVGERAGDEGAHRAADDEGAPRALEPREVARAPCRPTRSRARPASSRAAPPWPAITGARQRMPVGVQPARDRRRARRSIR